MKLVATEREGGIVSQTFIDAERGLVERRVMDAEPVIERNKQLLTQGDGYSKSREMRRVASIPTMVIEQWLKEGLDYQNPNHWPAIKRKLNSSEYAHLRTAPGRV